MLGFITLVVAFGMQVAFLILRISTKNWQPQATHFARIAAFTTFSLLTIAGVYWWGFRWMGLFLLLAVLAGFSASYFARHTKKEKQYRGFRVVLSCISGCLLVSFCILPGVLFPQFKEIAPTGSFDVDTQSVTLVDESRVDPFSPSGESRKLTVQFWYPSAAEDTDTFPLVSFLMAHLVFAAAIFRRLKTLPAMGMLFAASTTATIPFLPGIWTEAAHWSIWTS